MANKKLVDFGRGFNLHLGSDTDQGFHRCGGDISYGEGMPWTDYRSVLLRADLAAWLEENAEGDWSDIFWRAPRRHDPYEYYIRFTHESDMTLFKMRWM